MYVAVFSLHLCLAVSLCAPQHFKSPCLTERLTSNHAVLRAHVCMCAAAGCFSLGLSVSSWQQDDCCSSQRRGQRKTKGGRKRAKKRECGIRSLQGAVVDEMRNFRLISEYVSFFKLVWCCLSKWLLYLFLYTQSSQLEPLLEWNIDCLIVTFKHLQKMKVKVWIFCLNVAETTSKQQIAGGFSPRY